MGVPSYDLPTLGELNATEDPKIRTALSDLKTLLTDNLDDSNIAAGGIGAGSLAASAVTAANTADSFITSGTYTPTITNGTNIVSSTPRVTGYSRVGLMCWVAGSVGIDPTSGSATYTTFRMTIPVASNFASLFQAGGTGSSDELSQFKIRSDDATDTVEFLGYSGTTAAHDILFSFGYQII